MNKMTLSKLRLDNRSLLIIIFLLLLSGWFFWFQYRPSEIRKECQSKSTQLVISKVKQTGSNLLNPRIQEYGEFVYELCLHKKGL